MISVNCNLIGAGNNMTVTKIEFLGGDIVITFKDSSGNIKTIKQLFSDGLILATNAIVT